MIKAIDSNSVHQLCSGQVITNLQGCVKELIENSIDAGAKRIEVKLVNYGADLIEVIDDGSGVSKSNYLTFVQSHATSKLSSFSDLESIQTFGFRGEAVSSICQLSSSFVVTTCTADDSMGSQLEFSRTGSLVHEKSIARQVGTTVSVKNLFEPLPVRRKEFVKNIKKQYVNALQIVQAYALISCGVKITCTLITGDKRQPVCATPGGDSSIKDNIVNIFGKKFLTTLVDVNIKLGDDDEEDGEQVIGFVSKTGAGVGRQDSDRQFLFINGRPVDISKIVRVMNQTWRQYEMKNKPACVLNFVIKRGSFDINVSPDKREVMLTNEGKVLEKLKLGLEKMWVSSRYTFPINEVKIKSKIEVGKSIEKGEEEERGEDGEWDNDDDEEDEIIFEEEKSNRQDFKIKEKKTQQVEEGVEVVLDEKHTKIGLEKENNRIFEKVEKQMEVENDKLGEETETDSEEKEKEEEKESFNQNAILSEMEIDFNEKEKGLDSSLLLERDHLSSEKRSKKKEDSLIFSPILNTPTQTNHKIVNSEKNDDKMNNEKVEWRGKEREDPLASRNRFASNLSESSERRSKKKEDPSRDVLTPTHSIDILSNEDNLSSERSERSNNNNSRQNSELKRSHSFPDGNGSDDDERASKKRKEEVIDVDEAIVEDEDMLITNKVNNNEICVKFSLEDIKSRPLALPSTQDDVRFSQPTQIINQESLGGNCTKDGEAVLSRILNKESFQNMQVIGQFNKGFIISLYENDLFILDQHACDEKYNFENLQIKTQMHEQPLIQPMQLEISPHSEMTIMENFPVFKRNGFHFIIDEEKPCGQRLYLTKIPFSKGTTFGVQDVLELASLISENPSQLSTLLLPKATAMFASRACRMSIMIGDDLNTHQMKKIVNNLTGLEQPWNCPHGRPTLRHLADLSAVRAHFKDE